MKFGGAAFKKMKGLCVCFTDFLPLAYQVIGKILSGSSVVRGPSSVSIESHVQYIGGVVLLMYEIKMYFCV